MKYSKISTVKLAINTGFRTCLINLNDLIVKEGCLETMPFFVNKEIVIDMDCAESMIAHSESRSNYKSMDSAFVVKNGIGSEIIVFVEFRFNYKSMKNLKAKDLRGKKKFSTKNFNNLGHNNIHSNYYYVFDPNLKAQARRYFRSLYPSMPNNFKPVSISDLKADFF